MYYWGNKKEDKDKEGDSMSPAELLLSTNKVDLLHNRIYYYADVDEDSVLTLNKHIQALVIKAKIHAAQNEIPVEYAGQIFVNIQSFGGLIFSGLSAMDTLLEARETIPVTTLVDGCAASSATFLSVVGTYRLMRRNSYMLIHQLSGGMWGQYEELKDEMTNLDLFMDTIQDVYDKYTKVPKRELNKIMKKDLWWNAKTCLKYGLIDEII